MNDIFIREQPDQSSLLHAHVVAIRDTLLDFEGTIMDRLKTSSKGASLTESLAPYKDISTSAKTLEESEWPKFFFSNFFHPLWDEMAIKDGDSRRISRNKLYYDYFDHAQQRAWTLFGQFSRYREPGSKEQPEPKPDWVASFPIYDQFMSYMPPKSARWRWSASSALEDNVLENFSSSTLSNLANYGLEPSAAAFVRKQNHYIIFRSQAVCFPWLVVEHRKGTQTERECYEQAANAGASVVLMLRTLSRFTKIKADDTHIPPVVTVTTVGEIVRVWVTYSHQYSTERRMDCIWRGDMTVVEDVIKFQAILENLHTWAMRKLRPWISSYIDQWKDRFSEEAPLKHTDTSNGVPNTAKNDVKRPLSPPGFPVFTDNPEGGEDYSDGSLFRKILQTEQQKFIDQVQKVLQQSLEKNDSGCAHHSETQKPHQSTPAQTQHTTREDSLASLLSAVTINSPVSSQGSTGANIDLEDSASHRTTCIAPKHPSPDIFKESILEP